MSASHPFYKRAADGFEGVPWPTPKPSQAETLAKIRQSIRDTPADELAREMQKHGMEFDNPPPALPGLPRLYCYSIYRHDFGDGPFCGIETEADLVGRLLDYLTDRVKEYGKPPSPVLTAAAAPFTPAALAIAPPPAGAVDTFLKACEEWLSGEDLPEGMDATEWSWDYCPPHTDDKLSWEPAELPDPWAKMPAAILAIWEALTAPDLYEKMAAAAALIGADRLPEPEPVPTKPVHGMTEAEWKECERRRAGDSAICANCGKHESTHVGQVKGCFGGYGQIFTPRTRSE